MGCRTLYSGILSGSGVTEFIGGGGGGLEDGIAIIFPFTFIVHNQTSNGRPCSPQPPPPPIGTPLHQGGLNTAYISFININNLFL